MKQSQKSLLAIIIAFVAIILVSAGYGRTMLSKANISIVNDEERIFIASDLTGFNSIDASGVWQIEVIKGDTWSVATSSLEDYEGIVSVYVSDDTLVLKQRSSGFWWASNSSDLVAKIQMPNLELLDLSGAVEASLDGFGGDELTIDTSGAAELEAHNSRYNTLILDSSGAVEVNFKELTVINAQVDLSGASEVTLTMNGGELKGDISGAGSIDYYGTVSSESIDVSGAGDISHIK
jgi:hypothetical protein